MRCRGFNELQVLEAFLKDFLALRNPSTLGAKTAMPFKP